MIGGERPEWHEHAACRGAGTEVFFPERGESTAEAKQLCAVCTVRDECLASALANHEVHGIWGGFSSRQLRRLNRRAGGSIVLRRSSINFDERPDEEW